MSTDKDLLNLYRDAAGKPPFDADMRRGQLETLTNHAEAVAEAIGGLDWSAVDDKNDPWGDEPDARVGVGFAESTGGRPREVMHVELIDGGTTAARMVARLGKFNTVKGENGIVATAAGEDDLPVMFSALVRAYVARRAELTRSAEAVKNAVKS